MAGKDQVLVSISRCVQDLAQDLQIKNMETLANVVDRFVCVIEVDAFFVQVGLCGPSSRDGCRNGNADDNGDGSSNGDTGANFESPRSIKVWPKGAKKSCDYARKNVENSRDFRPHFALFTTTLQSISKQMLKRIEYQRE